MPGNSGSLWVGMGRFEKGSRVTQDIRTRSRWRTCVGAVLTVLWLGTGAYLLLSRPEQAGSLKLNELGDFLAGFVAPVAFLWLIIGYFQQGMELQLNTAALKLQQEELRRQVEETAALVGESRRQAEATTQLVEIQNREHKEATRIAKDRIQPRLEWQGFSRSGDGFEVRFQNVGGPAWNLSAKLDENSILIDPTDFLASGAIGKFDVYSGADRALLVVRYADRDGEQQTLELEYLEGVSFRPVPRDLSVWFPGLG